MRTPRQIRVPGSPKPVREKPAVKAPTQPQASPTPVSSVARIPFQLLHAVRVDQERDTLTYASLDRINPYSLPMVMGYTLRAEADPLVLLPFYNTMIFGGDVLFLMDSRTYYGNDLTILFNRVWKLRTLDTNMERMRMVNGESQWVSNGTVSLEFQS